jgi:hypothetical protein
MSGRSVALVAVVGIPTLLYLGAPLGERTAYKSRRYARETAALKALQSLNTAQVQYNSQHGRYARSLAELGPSAAGETHGYKFTLTATPQGYNIQAVPLDFGTTGVRSFYTDQSLCLRENYGSEPATANSREVASAVVKGEAR